MVVILIVLHFVFALCIGNPSNSASALVTNALSSQAAINSITLHGLIVFAQTQPRSIGYVQVLWQALHLWGYKNKVPYLAGIKGFNVTKCRKVPPTVKKEMFALLIQRRPVKGNRKPRKRKERKGIN